MHALVISFTATHNETLQEGMNPPNRDTIGRADLRKLQCGWSVVRLALGNRGRAGERSTGRTILATLHHNVTTKQQTNCLDTVCHALQMLSHPGATISPISKDNESMPSWNEPRSLGLLNSIEDWLEKADARLFGRLQNPTHCLYPILPTNSKSYQHLWGKENINSFACSHCTYIICIKTPFSPVAF